MKIKVFFLVFVLLICALSGWLYFSYFFVFGDGVKSGQLNQIVHKGYVFKTYEGRLIQSGFKKAEGNTIQSYEFNFSVEDETVAHKLERLSGKEVELHYKEYKNALPWRGNSNYVVDSIISISGVSEEHNKKEIIPSRQGENEAQVVSTTNL